MDKFTGNAIFVFFMGGGGEEMQICFQYWRGKHEIYVQETEDLRREHKPFHFMHSGL